MRNEPTALAQWQIDRIEEFVRSIASFGRVLTPFLSLVALRGHDANTVVSGRLTFATPTATLIERTFESSSVTALSRRLPDLSAAERVIGSFAAGQFDFEGQSYLFPSEEGGIRVDFEPFHQGAGQQTRLSVLTMRGCSTTRLIDSAQLDWELRAAAPPHLTFQELLAEYGVLVPQGSAIFEAYHALPIAIDGGRTSLDDTTATITLKMERGLDPSEAQLGVVAVRSGETPQRQTIAGTRLEWEDDGQFLIGTIDCQVPAGRLVQAIASLSGTAYNFWWIVDPRHVINPRKGVFEVVDAELAILRELITNSPKGAARDFESAMDSLLWLLGFSVAHLGSNKLTQDAVDILAATPGGNFALVECTTGVISADRKVPNLLRRRALVLEKLGRSGHNALRVLPVLVTSCAREEVEQEILPAQRRGVLVLTKTDLEEMLNQTDLMFNADEIYRRAEEQIASAVEASEPSLPGIQ